MKYFVYVYSNEEGVPYYVGKGCLNRHLYRRNKSVTPPSKEFIQKFPCSTEQEAFEMEIFLIDFFGRKLNDGLLDNLSLGGPGCRGYQASPRKPRPKCPASPGILDRPSVVI